jgi:hypothetical protein
LGPKSADTRSKPLVFNTFVSVGENRRSLFNQPRNVMNRRQKGILAGFRLAALSLLQGTGSAAGDISDSA